jgi:hypothetical protein
MTTNGLPRIPIKGVLPGGRNWVQTSDPSLVREPSYLALTRANAERREDSGAYQA